MAASLPTSVHVSRHACLRVKLSQLRSQETSAREVKALIHEITTIIGCEALSDLAIVSSGQEKTPLGYDFTAERLAPARISLMPILRSGLGMLDGECQ